MRRPIYQKRLAGLLALTLTLALTGCGGTTRGTGNTDQSLQAVLDAGELILGLDTAFPPMGFIDETGEIVGFDIDVAQEVCDRLGVKLVKQSIDWDNKENDLNEGRIDCIWNGLSVTPARAEAMCLSEPYMKNELIIVVPGSSVVKGMEDLSGRIVGVQSGSTTQEVLEASAFFPDIQVMCFDTMQELLERLKTGDVEAALVDSVAAFYFIFSSDAPFFILPDSLGEEDYAIAFRKGDQALRDRVQEIISAMKADGTMGEISTKWFGSDITTVR